MGGKTDEMRGDLPFDIAPVDNIADDPKDGRRAAAALLRGGVRVRTLLVIRWTAIIGQAITVAITKEMLGYPLPLADCLALVIASVLANLFLTFTRRSATWLPESEAALHLSYDVLQLSALLYLTGGLENPFAILMLAPVTVAASVLSPGYTILITSTACTAFSLLAVFHQPLPWMPGSLVLPSLYLVGFWGALMVAVAFIAGYVGRVSTDNRRMAAALTATQWALAREQRLSALGGLAAAVAHRLGSPLGTIAVVARELAHDLPAGSPWAEDVELLLSESARCRTILAELANAPEDDGGAPFHIPALSALVTELIDNRDEPASGRIAELRTQALDNALEPNVLRRPELMHGLDSFIENALQFARHRVTVTLLWSTRLVSVVIEDDGPGFPPQVRARFGEPYISTRAGQQSHMGLGMFIAVTLLARTGARVTITNRQDGGDLNRRRAGQPTAEAPPGATVGARVAIRWRRSDIEAKPIPPPERPVPERHPAERHHEDTQ